MKVTSTFAEKKNNMEIKKRDFIIKHFGCYTTIDGKQVLTSLANASRVPVEEFWNVFSGDAYDFFQIRQTEDEKELTLILDDAIRRRIEREIEYERISKLKVGVRWEWINHNARCYLEDEAHQLRMIPFIFAINDPNLLQDGVSHIDKSGLNTVIIDNANMIPVNSGAIGITYPYLSQGCTAYELKGGKYGCLNKMANVQIPLIFDKCIWFTNPFTAIAVRDGRKLLINKWGECLEHDYDDLICFYGDFCVVKKNEKFGIVDYNLKVIVPIEYDKIECRSYSNKGNTPIFNTVLLYLGSHCGLFDLVKKQFIFNIAFDKIIEHHNNRDAISVCINEKWGLMDKKGNVIIPVEYKYFTTDNEGLVYKNGKYGIVDKILSDDFHSWNWKDVSFCECVPCIYDEVFNTKGEVTHTQVLFQYFRFYFAKIKSNDVQIDCYFKLYHKNNGVIDFTTYEKLTSLYCNKENIRDTIIAFDAKQKNEPLYTNE